MEWFTWALVIKVCVLMGMGTLCMVVLNCFGFTDEGKGSSSYD